MLAPEPAPLADPATAPAAAPAAVWIDDTLDLEEETVQKINLVFDKLSGEVRARRRRAQAR